MLASKSKKRKTNDPGGNSNWWSLFGFHWTLWSVIYVIYATTHRGRRRSSRTSPNNTQGSSPLLLRDCIFLENSPKKLGSFTILTCINRYLWGWNIRIFFNFHIRDTTGRKLLGSTPRCESTFNTWKFRWETRSLRNSKKTSYCTVTVLLNLNS